MTLRMTGKKLYCGVSVTQVPSPDGPTCGMVVKLKNTKYMYRHLDTSGDTLADFTFDSIVGNSPQMQEATRIAKIAANSDANVLLLGESGTGKELFAQAIHNHGDRRDKPFVAINLGALPQSLIESELFGYEGGSFTGSKKEGHKGKFELA
ncbi:MAG: sigma 54-interacting transcriptional regulator, partial [Firmicutes bacterium]|nr:sigma 54-interacting transcriptional regulator [Bacillota bacterium]